ncbi:MAG TPA: DNA methyltransferase [Blastocatellia bacterium]|nr:DNA methyltransferase [Blastocatellia bacterium]
MQIPSRFALEMTRRGWLLRNEIIWWKPNCLPESVKDRFTVDYEEFFFFVKSRHYWSEQQFEPLSK